MPETAATNTIPRSLESLFAHAYLILFGKLAVGGLLSLAVPPFFEIERGFYKSTATVYLAAACSITAGEAYLYLGAHPPATLFGVTLVGWTVFTIVFFAYCVTLFIELPSLRARFFPAAVGCGALALGSTALGYLPEGVSPVAAVPIALALLVGAAACGAATTGMLLGHWYLIETGLDLTPLNRILRYCWACLTAEIGVVGGGALILYLWPGSPFEPAFDQVFAGGFEWLVLARLAAWGLALVVLALIARTLAIPQTMAATGLFYVAALIAAVGQICSHWLLFRTQLPL